jgi:hypothetical protein
MIIKEKNSFVAVVLCIDIRKREKTTLILNNLFFWKEKLIKYDCHVSFPNCDY